MYYRKRVKTFKNSYFHDLNFFHRLQNQTKLIFILDLRSLIIVFSETQNHVAQCNYYKLNNYYDKVLLKNTSNFIKESDLSYYL